MKERAFLVLLLLFLGMAGCGRQKKPDPDAVTQQFQQDQADLETIAAWLLAAEQKEIYINTEKGQLSIFADFEDLPLDDSLLPPINRLKKQWQYADMAKHEDWNALVFPMWTDHLERECGVVYAIDPEKAPTVQFLTQLEPLSEEGWYYYVSDYNLWRSQHTAMEELP